MTNGVNRMLGYGKISLVPPYELLKEMNKMFEESKELKLIRGVRDKHYEETKGMNSKQLLDFYKKKVGKMNLKKL